MAAPEIRVDFPPELIIQLQKAENPAINFSPTFSPALPEIRPNITVNVEPAPVLPATNTILPAPDVRVESPTVIVNYHVRWGVFAIILFANTLLFASLLASYHFYLKN